MSKQLEGVCFDFDGVLMNSPVAGFERMCEVFTFFEIREPTWEEFFKDYREVIKRYYKECEACEPTQREIHDWFKYYSFDIDVSFFPEVPHVIRTLHEREVPMWVISANATEVIETLLVTQNIHHLFDEVRGDEFEKSKALRAYCTKHSVTPEAGAYVGDFPVDMKEARKAGTYAVGRKTRKETDGILVKCGADMCIETLHELLPLVPEKENKALQFEITMKPCSKGRKGKTGKEFMVREYDSDGTVVRTQEDNAPTFSKVRKKLGSIVPGDILARTKIRNHGTTHIYT